MADAKKLLEAARMLKNHCRQMESCEKCFFGFDIGSDVLRCGISTSAGMPCGWILPNNARWTPADKALAAGLKVNGYTSITRVYGSGHVIVSLKESPDSLDLGKDLFAGLCRNEVVNLDDIIGEG